MNGDGSDKQPAVTDPLYDAQTDWSPDGTQSSQPAWFPDMTGIVYRRTNAPGTTRSDIWAMDVDGTNRRAVLTAPDDQWYPSLSPDKSKLLFSTTIRPNDRNVQVMDMGTGVVTTLYDVLGRNDSAPAWSPDGRLIAFESDGELYLMDADGANVRRLTDTPSAEEGPAWSPDGTRLAFARSTATSNNDVWTMAADGTDERRLTDDPRPEESPDWGRNPGPAAVGGTVPATLALSLPGPVSLGAFIPGIAREYTASTTATVTSTAAITFTQPIGANDPLRTGTYTKTLTFTLATTEP